MKILMLSAAIFSLITTSGIDKKCAKADLAVLEIEDPKWEHEVKSTYVTVTISNKGSKTSGPFTISIEDLDISYEDAKKLNLSEFILEMIEENNGRAAYFKTTSDSTFVDENMYDYDPYFKESREVESLEPGQKLQVTFIINGHWVYDSNCELRVIIDENKAVNDCDRSNNILDFFGWG